MYWQKNVFDTLSYHKLIDWVGKTVIVAYKEPTQQLAIFLNQEGFNCQVLKQEDRAEYQNFSPSYRCFLNHQDAWKIAANSSKPTLIIEADFVPVINFGQLPLTFNPHDKSVGVAWLYTCASQVYAVSLEGFAEGFSVSTVAYIITPQAAKCLLDFAAKITQTNQPTAYLSWDSKIDEFLRRKNFKNYIPFRNYGEHGGLPNLEHHHHGLSRTHRADVLYNKLAFMPLYVTETNIGRVGFLSIRSQSHLKGILRLLMGKFLRLPVVRKSSFPGRLIKFAVSRQCSIWL